MHVVIGRLDRLNAAANFIHHERLSSAALLASGGTVGSVEPVQVNNNNENKLKKTEEQVVSGSVQTVLKDDCGCRDCGCLISARRDQKVAPAAFLSGKSCRWLCLTPAECSAARCGSDMCQALPPRPRADTAPAYCLMWLSRLINLGVAV